MTSFSPAPAFHKRVLDRSRPAELPVSKASCCWSVWTYVVAWCAGAGVFAGQHADQHPKEQRLACAHAGQISQHSVAQKPAVWPCVLVVTAAGLALQLKWSEHAIKRLARTAAAQIPLSLSLCWVFEVEVCGSCGISIFTGGADRCKLSGFTQSTSWLSECHGPALAV